MRQLFFLYSFLFTFLVFGQDFPEKPDPARLVNDYADVLSPQEEQALENKLVAYNDSTSTQIAIVTRKSLGDYDASDYAFQLAKKWGIGQKGFNNGVLILVSIEDRHSFIATGYGMEGVMPDALVGRIKDENLRPNLQAGRFYDAFDQTTTSLFALAKGEYKAKPVNKSKKKGFPIAPLIFLGFIFFFVILPIFRKGSRVRNSHMGGGGALGWLSTLFLMNSMGRDGRRDGGSWGDFSGGRGDFGGGGGGFGGFGGGDFGGGGSGGDW